VTDLKSILTKTTTLLQANDIEDASLEARVLLQHILGISPALLYTQLERTLAENELVGIRAATERRLQREPLAYILNDQPFFARDYYVDSRVLIPRPETELLVEKAIEFIEHNACSAVADVGTGSGVIAISLAIAKPGLRVYASDISADALDVASINCVRYNVTDQVLLLHGNLLEPVPEPVGMIVANLPYVRESELDQLGPELTHEPNRALCGGPDGLRHIGKLLQEATDKIRPMGCLLLEIGYGQLEPVLALATKYLPQAHATVFKDFNEHDRVVRLVFY